MKTQNSLFPAALFTALTPAAIILMVWLNVTSFGDGLASEMFLLTLFLLFPAVIGFPIAVFQFVKKYRQQPNANMFSYVALSVLIFALISVVGTQFLT